MYAKVGKPEQKSTKVSTIEYDLKSRQVMMNIVSFTDVGLRRLKILNTHRGDVDTVNEYVMQLQYIE